MMPLLKLLLAVVAIVGGLDKVASAVQPEVRKVTYESRSIEAEESLTDPVVQSLARNLDRDGVSLTAVWTNPDGSDSLLAIIIAPATEREYGPQLVLIDLGSGSPRIVHDSPRLFDDDFIHPNFFKFSAHVLLLADHGSEDAYGVIVWSLEDGTVREIGELPIALPEEGDGFTRGAGRFATVHHSAGRHTIEIPGPVLLNPRAEDETLLVDTGAVARFCETSGGFVQCP